MTRTLTAEEILAPQPNPVPTPASTRVYDALVEYLRTVPDSGRLVELVTRRHEQGIGRYGLPLLTHVGRDYLLDMTQELVDAVGYHAAYLLEQGRPLDGLAGDLRAALALADVSQTARAAPPVAHTDAEIRDAGRRALGYPPSGQDPHLGPWEAYTYLDDGGYYEAEGVGVRVIASKRVAATGWLVTIDFLDDDGWGLVHETPRASLAEVVAWLRARGWVPQPAPEGT